MVAVVFFGAAAFLIVVAFLVVAVADFAAVGFFVVALVVSALDVVTDLVAGFLAGTGFAAATGLALVVVDFFATGFVFCEDVSDV